MHQKGSSSAEMPCGKGRDPAVAMRPMSLYELRDSDGSVSLSDLFDGKDVDGHSEMDLETMGGLIIRGGWPQTQGADDATVRRTLSGCLDSITRTEMSSVDGVRRDPYVARKLLEALSRHTSTAASVSAIRRDMGEHHATVSDKTVSSYIAALRYLSVVSDVPAWDAELRSKAIIRRSPCRYVADPSLAAASLGATVPDLFSDMGTYRLLYRTLCMRDIRVYAQVLDADIHHYRDNNGLEADAVVRLRDGRWGAMEYRMGATSVDDGARDLLKLANIVENPPSFLAVVTLGGYAYRRLDGVYVVPIGCLRNRFPTVVTQ